MRTRIEMVHPFRIDVELQFLLPANMQQPANLFIIIDWNIVIEIVESCKRSHSIIACSVVSMLLPIRITISSEHLPCIDWLTCQIHAWTQYPLVWTLRKWRTKWTLEKYILFEWWCHRNSFPLNSKIKSVHLAAQHAARHLTDAFLFNIRHVNWYELRVSCTLGSLILHTEFQWGYFTAGKIRKNAEKWYWS